MTVPVNQEAVNNRAKLMMHRIVARRLARDSSLVSIARAKLSDGSRALDASAEWRDLLSLDLPELRRQITARTERMERLRLSSPFATGFTDPQLRRRIWQLARKGAGGSARRRAAA